MQRRCFSGAVHCTVRDAVTNETVGTSGTVGTDPEDGEHLPLMRRIVAAAAEQGYGAILIAVGEPIGVGEIMHGDQGIGCSRGITGVALENCFPRNTVRWRVPAQSGDGEVRNARGGGDYAEPQYGPPVLSWFNSGLNGQGRPLTGLGRSPAWRF